MVLEKYDFGCSTEKENTQLLSLRWKERRTDTGPLDHEAGFLVAPNLIFREGSSNTRPIRTEDIEKDIKPRNVNDHAKLFVRAVVGHLVTKKCHAKDDDNGRGGTKKMRKERRGTSRLVGR